MITRPQLACKRLIDSPSICTRCLLRLSRSSRVLRRSSGLASIKRPNTSIINESPVFRREFFLSNGFPAIYSGETSRNSAVLEAPGLEKRDPEESPVAEVSKPIPPSTQHLPHRRKQLQRQQDADLLHASVPSEREAALPLDASSQLSALSSTLPTRSLRRLLTTYLSLSKPRLSFLILLTTTSAYSLFPVPALLLPSTTDSPSLSTLTLLFLTSGTALSCASANTLNMLMEPKYDALMSRTRNRPLVRNLISKKGALVFAMLTGATGLTALWYGVNPTVAFLSGLNIALYAGVYTPMKRVSVINTWIGAVVGGIPPLMGWAAAAGQSATGNGSWQELLLGPASLGGWLLSALLFAWQFPHFNALSWTIREEYRQAGHRMLAWTNPRLNALVALRYALLFVPICFSLTAVGVTDRGFLLTSSLVNAWMIKEAWRFWRKEGKGGTARALFWVSVWHLPVVMVLAMVHKKGNWDGVFREVVGWVEDDEDEGDLAEVGSQEIKMTCEFLNIFPKDPEGM
ncbi:MAG: Protoheme IX farnesyltransferase, mitochondrial [Trizodia sp. TS-e1964]|nr:MAG: Protoheme IX farnesyltransferase, mitochondrial [Trizodia sp. TS-e1964]